MSNSVQIDLIENGDRLRETSPAHVSSLVNSISEVGLLNPITVVSQRVLRRGNYVDGFGLVAGAHRLAACRELGFTDIAANIVELSDLARQIAECDENLCVSSLSKAERALFTKRRKEAYEALHPETRHGGERASRQVGDLNETERFTADTAAATGQSERSVQRDAERGERISEAAIALVRATPLDTGKYLDSLKSLPDAEQIAKVQADLAERAEVANAPARKAAAVERDVKQRAAQECAEIIANCVPHDMWDGMKANLYAAGAKSVADALTNHLGNSVMDGAA